MRTLKFDVDGLIVSKNPSCDFDNLIPGTAGYLKAEFSFSSDWNGTVKVVEFLRGSIEYTPQVLEDGRSCFIPEEVLAYPRFQIRVHGKREGLRLKTNRLEVCQKGD